MEYFSEVKITYAHLIIHSLPVQGMLVEMTLDFANNWNEGFKRKCITA